MAPMRVGVLAVQGNFREHAAMLRALGADVVEVRLPEQLEGLDGLVIPGGESTAITRLMRLYGLEEAIRRFAAPVFGTCAGMILLDRAHLGLVDVDVERNGYGRQLASFEADLDLGDDGGPMRGVFIRAPRVTDAGRGRRGAREPRRRAGAAAAGTLPRRLVPPGADRRHARARALPGAGTRGDAVSGHSKWSTIKHKKGAADAKRGKLFTKLSKAIIVAAKEGGPDPNGNLSLQNAIEKAKSYSMPKDTIERAIARGAGTDADAAAYETIVYEGYGPDGVAVLVEALTDNRNRTASDVRHTFSKHGGNLGTTGAVAWLFERRGVVLVDADGADEDELTLAAAEGGADDVERDGDVFQVSSAPEALTAVREAIEAAGIEVQSAELTMIPKTTVEVAEEASAKKLIRLIEALEDNDDVQEVSANFDIPEQVLEAVAWLGRNVRRAA